MTSMTSQFLTIRLNAEDVLLVARLHAKTGLTKSEIVKQALRGMERQTGASNDGSLCGLAAKVIGRHGDATRQSAEIKRVVRARLNAKRTG